ncbi:MAG: hypothetical protein FWF77_02900 [Defluviitaleaceae bacterium]|nr:hypothetical protein [Defluviitaleaceae bacterium]
MKLRTVAVIFAAMFAFAFLSGCGGTGHGEGDTPDTAGLVGEWNWDETGSLYYTFNADGTGRMLVLGNIRWSTSNGILSVCVTPGLCGSVSNCSDPQVWTYNLTGDTLVLTGAGTGVAAGLASGPFTYIRR